MTDLRDQTVIRGQNVTFYAIASPCKSGLRYSIILKAIQPNTHTHSLWCRGGWIRVWIERVWGVDTPQCWSLWCPTRASRPRTAGCGRDTHRSDEEPPRNPGESGWSDPIGETPMKHHSRPACMRVCVCAHVWPQRSVGSASSALLTHSGYGSGAAACDSTCEETTRTHQHTTAADHHPDPPHQYLTRLFIYIILKRCFICNISKWNYI